MKKHFSFLIVFILLATSAYAQETDKGIDKQDYKNADFLRSSDPATWVWSEVDFSNPAVYQNPKLYLSPQFSANFHNVPPHLYGMIKFYQLDFNLLQYGSLKDEFYQHPAFAFNLKRVPANKYTEVKWDKVDFQKIRFNDVNWNAPLPSSFHQSLAKDKNALNNYCREQSKGVCNIQVDSGEVRNVVFTGKGMKLGTYSVELKHYPSGARYEVVDGRIVVQIVDGQVALPARLGSDVVRIVATRDLIIAFPNAKQGELKTIQGTLEYNNGEWSVPPENSAIINHVEITTFDEKTVIHGLDGKSSAFSDFEPKLGEQPEKLQDMHASFDKNVVYFGKEKILAVGARCQDCPITTQTVTLDFQPGNPYITIKERGESVYEQAHDDRLTITPVSGGAVWNGKDELIISGRVRMQNGVQEIIFNNGGVYAKAVLEDENKPFFDSVPMKVRFFDELMNNPYRDANDQPLKDKQGKPIDNTIDIQEDNFIEFGNVEFFALAVDPHHLLKDTKNGFKLVNNIARFTKPLIIVETPVREKWEQEYFDAAAQILHINVGNQFVPIIVKLENSDDKSEQSKRVIVHSAFLEAFNEETKRSLKPGTVIQSEQMVIGHSQIEWETGTVYIDPGIVEFTSRKGIEFCSPERTIGCSIADIKIHQIYEQTIQQEKGKILMVARGINENGDPIGGDLFVDSKTKKYYISDAGYAKIWPKIKQKLTNDPLIVETFNVWEKDKRVSIAEIQVKKAPLYTAMKVAELKFPFLKEKSVEEILISPEMEQIIFPNEKIAKSAEITVEKITNKRPTYHFK